MKNEFPSYIMDLLVKIGSPYRLDQGERRKRITAAFALLITMIAMVLFSVYHFYSQHYSVVALDGLGFFLSLLLLLYLRKMVKADGVYLGICSFYIVLCSITTIIGRTEISFFLWSFVLPIACFSLLGDQKGIGFTIFFFCLSLFLMTAPERMLFSKPYSSYVVARYGIIYIIITLASYYYESSQKVLINDIQQEKDKYERASKLDPLTGLFNRREMMARMENEQKRQLQNNNYFTVILSDIDNFKGINDTFGHDTGDHVLKMITLIIKDQIRGIDCFSRWGGEEFLIMLIETSLDGGQNVAERIRKKIEEAEFNYKNSNISVTMTFGLSVHQGTDDNIESCIKRADQALYEGKKQGKNRIIMNKKSLVSD